MIVSSSDATPLVAQHRRPLVEPDVHRLPRRLVGRRHALDRPADERAQRGGADTRPDERPFDRLEQRQPLPGDRRAEDAARHRRSRPARRPRRARRARGRPGGGSPRARAMSPGSDGRRADGLGAVGAAADQLGARRQQRRRCRRRGRRPPRAGPSRCSPSPLRVSAIRPSSRCDDAHPQRGGVRGVAQPGVAMRRRRPRTVPVLDARVAERDAVEQRVVGRRGDPWSLRQLRAEGRDGGGLARPRRGRCARRRRGTRRSPAWGRRSARASSRRRRTPCGRSPTAPGRCPGTRRPSRRRSAPGAAPPPSGRAARRCEPGQQVVVGEDAASAACAARPRRARPRPAASASPPAGPSASTGTIAAAGWRTTVAADLACHGEGELRRAVPGGRTCAGRGRRRPRRRGRTGPRRT